MSLISYIYSATMHALYVVDTYVPLGLKHY